MDTLEKKATPIDSFFWSKIRKKEKQGPNRGNTTGEMAYSEEDINHLVDQLETLSNRHDRGEPVYFREFEWTVRKAGFCVEEIIGTLFARELFVDMINSLNSIPPTILKIIDRTPCPRAHCAASWYDELKNNVHKYKRSI